MFSQDRRSHPHDILYLGLVSVVSVAIVSVGFHVFAASSASALQKFEDSGVISLTSSQLVSHTKKDDGLGYWFGPRGKSTFLENDNGLGTDTISYLPEGSNPSNMHSPVVTIVTYDNEATFASAIHNMGIGSVGQFVAAGGSTVQYGLNSMKDEMVTFRGKPQIVVITYSTPQTAKTLRVNAEDLKLVQ